MGEQNESAAVSSADQQLREAQSVQQIAQVIECLGNAKAAQDALNDIRAAVTQVQAIATVLDSGESEPATETLQLVRVGLEGMFGDAFDPVLAKHGVSLEALELIQGAVETTRGSLDQQAVDANLKLVAALNSALPVVCARVAETVRLLREQPSLTVTEFSDNDGLVRALSVNGALPADFGDYYNRYVQLGETLLNMYSDEAFRGAMQTGQFAAALRCATPAAFWASVGTQLDAIGDARRALTEEQLEISLPGGSTLFGPKQEATQCENPILRAVIEYRSSRTPIDPTVASAKVVENTEAQDGAVKSLSGLVQALERLCKFLGTVNLQTYMDASNASWVTISRVINDTLDCLNNHPQDVKDALDLDSATKHLVRYLSMVEQLARWPLLHYCVNLLLTSNALVLLAQRALDPSAVDVTEQVLEEQKQAEEKSGEDAGDTDEKPDDESEETADTDDVDDTEAREEADESNQSDEGSSQTDSSDAQSDDDTED